MENYNRYTHPSEIDAFLRPRDGYGRVPQIDGEPEPRKSDVAPLPRKTDVAPLPRKTNVAPLHSYEVL